MIRTEARLALYEDTVLPLVDLLLADWNNWLTDGEVEIKANLDKVPAIAERRINEARQVLR